MTTTTYPVAVRERMHVLSIDLQTTEQDEEIDVLYKANGSKNVIDKNADILTMHDLQLYATTRNGRS
jgi:hypothetical protein